jgi:hypothetical protein
MTVAITGNDYRMNSVSSAPYTGGQHSILLIARRTPLLCARQ